VNYLYDGGEFPLSSAINNIATVSSRYIDDASDVTGFAACIDTAPSLATTTFIIEVSLLLPSLNYFVLFLYTYIYTHIYMYVCMYECISSSLHIYIYVCIFFLYDTERGDIEKWDHGDGGGHRKEPSPGPSF
jgi:hypothetical protein